MNDVDLVSERLAAVVKDPETAAAIGARGRAFALEVQKDVPFPHRLESILRAAVQRQRPPTTRRQSAEDTGVEARDRFRLTYLVAAAMAELYGHPETASAVSPAKPGVSWARQVLNTVEQCVAEGAKALQPLALAVRIEIAVASAEDEADQEGCGGGLDPLFRLRTNRWAMKQGELAELVPVRDPRLRVIDFDFDVAPYIEAESVGELPAEAAPRPSFVVIFASSDAGRRDRLLVDELTAAVLRRSDGTLTVSDILSELGQEGEPAGMRNTLTWIERLFGLGLISLRDTPVRSDAVVEAGEVFPSASNSREAVDIQP